MKISHVDRPLMVHLHDGSVGLSRPRGPAHGPTFPARAATYTTGRQPGDAAQYTARRSALRLAALAWLTIMALAWTRRADLELRGSS
jgi:hypothetical protein